MKFRLKKLKNTILVFVEISLDLYNLERERDRERELVFSSTEIKNIRSKINLYFIQYLKAEDLFYKGKTSRTIRTIIELWNGNTLE